MGGGLESRCVGRVYGADGAAQHFTLFHEEDAWSNKPQVSVCQNVISLCYIMLWIVESRTLRRVCK